MAADYSPSTHRWAVAALFTVNGFIMGAWAPHIPLLLPRHTITEGTLGLLILCLGLGAVAAMLFTGRLIAAHGSARVASAFALAATPMLAAVVYAPNIWVLAVMMALMGAVLGCMDVSMNANAVQVERKLHRAIMSSSHGFWSLGGFVGGIGGSWLIVQVGAERQAMIVGGLSILLVLTALPYLLKDAPTAQARDTRTPKTKLIARDASLWVLGAMALFSMVPEGAVLDWAAIYLQKELGAGPFASGLGFAFFAGAMAVMRFVGDGVRNHHGAVKTLRVSAVLGAAGLAISGLAPTPAMAVAGFAVAGLGVANMVPILFSAAGNWPGLPPGIGISSVTMVGYAGILIAPALIGFVAQHIGYRATYLALALVLGGVALMAGRAHPADDLQRG
ncbi:MAG: MFS transporter [Cypionkella sp.]|nr:MFS transporter [Cypionkella sp.]